MDIVGLDNESQREVTEMKARVSGLMDGAPSDASATFFIKKDGGDYYGLLKIRSIRSKFVSACRSPNFKQMIDTIIRDTKQQIDEWKKQRVDSLSYST